MWTTACASVATTLRFAWCAVCVCPMPSPFSWVLAVVARWEKYTIAYRNGGALDPTSSPHLFAVKATPCISVVEESFFGALSDQWKLMGPTAAPGRVSATAIKCKC